MAALAVAHTPRLQPQRTARLAHTPPPRATRPTAHADANDWRDVRARLVRAEKRDDDHDDSLDATNKFVFESPLIEQGSLILGGTEQEFSFALRQQYFHKSVMLLLQHDDHFTKGIILNRPSAFELEGWRVWFGGDVAEGGLFRPPNKPKSLGPREIVCLHSLNSTSAERLSIPVIRGVSHTTLDGARSLVQSGDARKSDFWIFVGYAGWAPGQLQAEVDRDSWFLASADSEVLLEKLLEQGKGLPPPDAEPVAGDGLSTWEALMRSIGRDGQAMRTRDSLEDRMLREWVAQRLYPAPPPPPPVLPPMLPDAADLAGLVLRAGPHARGYTLDNQFMHKSLLLVVHSIPDQEVSLACVLNRPTANIVQLNLPQAPRRCIIFGGDSRVRGGNLGVDANGLLWIHRRPELGGVPIGSQTDGAADSAVLRTTAAEAAAHIQEGRAALGDFLIISGVVPLERDSLEAQLQSGELELVREPAKLWHQVWSVADVPNGGEGGESAPSAELISDGTALWWAAAQTGRESLGLSSTERVPEPSTIEALPPAGLPDEALAMWLRFFAGHDTERQGDLNE